ncbi:hypothetical protein CN285_28260 [Bacillus cereus]|uniref:hypothetical protein n=1 Tax=Bacillus paramycoides TaxID=2026194 RepID=UPI000BF414F1|nr:hypothetical protein [Bacillus paramycoides]PFD31313.1 hypothetical protein CN285_28260 [Bacillus cereus]
MKKQQKKRTKGALLTLLIIIALVVTAFCFTVSSGKSPCFSIKVPGVSIQMATSDCNISKVK